MGLEQCCCSGESTRLPPRCVLSSIPRLHVTSALSLLVLYPAPRVAFSSGTPVFPLSQKQVFKLILFEFICIVSPIGAPALGIT